MPVPIFTCPTTIHCHSVKNNSQHTLNKYELLGTFALLKTTAKHFLLQQSKETARAMRKQLRKEINIENLNNAYSFINPSETIANLIARLNDLVKKSQKQEILREIYVHNQLLAQKLQAELKPVGVNTYERNVALYLAEQYFSEALTLNLPILKNDILVKEFDGVARGKTSTLIEEKLTLNKRHLRDIFAYLPDKKLSHLAIINDQLICQQNELPKFEQLHIIFSEIEDSLLTPQKRKYFARLNNFSTLELSADKFISLFESDVRLPNAKQLLHSSGIKTIVLTQLDEIQADLAWWIL